MKQIFKDFFIYLFIQNDQLDEKIKSKDDIDFIKLNRQLAVNRQIKRAPSVEMLKKVEQKKQHELENYELKIKGKVPEQ